MSKGKDLTVVSKELDSLMDKFFGNRFRQNFLDEFKSLMNWDFPTIEFSMLQPKGKLPKVNVSETEEGFDVEIAMAGFNKDNLELTLEDNCLQISCKSCEEKEDTAKNYLMKEISCRDFYRAIRLPKEVDSEQVAAEYKDGIVNVSLKKKPAEEKDSKVKIDVK